MDRATKRASEATVKVAQGRARGIWPGVPEQRGIALVVVLWALMLLTVIASAFAFSVRVESALTQNMVARAKAQALAEGAMRWGAAELMRRNRDPRWQPGAAPLSLVLGGAEVTVEVIPETAKVDVNASPDPLVVGLLESLAQDNEELDAEAAGAIAQAILDWRDADHRRRLEGGSQGAEDGDYQRAGLGYEARDAVFLTMEEIGLVLGVTPQYLALLEPHITIHSRLPQIDPRSASERVLRAIPGVSDEDVTRFLSEREAFFAGSEEEAGTGTGTGQSGRARLPTQLLRGGSRYLSRARAAVYTFVATVKVDGAKWRQRAVLRLTGDIARPYRIISWAGLEAVPSQDGESGDESGDESRDNAAPRDV